MPLKRQWNLITFCHPIQLQRDNKFLSSVPSALENFQLPSTSRYRSVCHYSSSSQFATIVQPWNLKMSCVYQSGSSCQLLSSGSTWQLKPFPGRQATLYTSRGLSTVRRLCCRKERNAWRKLAQTLGCQQPTASLGSDRSAMLSTLRTKPASSRQPHTISSIPTK